MKFPHATQDAAKCKGDFKSGMTRIFEIVLAIQQEPKSDLKIKLQSSFLPSLTGHDSSLKQTCKASSNTGTWGLTVSCETCKDPYVLHPPTLRTKTKSTFLIDVLYKYCLSLYLGSQLCNTSAGSLSDSVIVCFRLSDVKLHLET